jgi:hypothetical protein
MLYLLAFLTPPLAGLFTIWYLERDREKKIAQVERPRDRRRSLRSKVCARW